MPPAPPREPRPESLPAPSPEAAAHGERLCQHIREEIARGGGAIPFQRYMELALYAPGLGYYSAGSRKLGAEGDFVTAPELTPAFGRCVARQAAEVLETLGGGDIVEVGAGSGALAAAALGELERLGAPLGRYLILERSAELRARQQAALAGQGGRVGWLEDLPAPGFRGVVLANELLDALPAARFEVAPGGVREHYVTWEGGRFRWLADEPEHPVLGRAVDAIQRELAEPMPPGYVSELALAQRAWAREAAGRLGAGLLLILDYGYPRAEYYHPQRHGGTLSCFYRHRTHADPLILTGLQDISVHVDFTAVAEAGAAAGLELAGFTSQADFLLSLGVLDELVALAPGSPQHAALTRAIKRLTLPSDMGEVSKAMALTRAHRTPLAGFARTDRRGRL